MTENITRVRVSGEALREYSRRLREWSGWRHMVVVNEDPKVSDVAALDPNTGKVFANFDNLVRNPNRVLLTVNPFRLRQEAVLTGALMHEAAHARFTKWTPKNWEERQAMRHYDGEEVTDNTFALAKILEEPRVEALMAANADTARVEGYEWTMLASAAALIGPTELSDDPNQRLMEILTSWILRAGRRVALAFHVGGSVESWVYDFTKLLLDEVVEHFKAMGDDESTAKQKASNVNSCLTEALRWRGTEDTDVLDLARSILDLLFPSDQTTQPQVQSGCAAGSADEGEESESESGADGEGDEEGAGGEGNTEPEDDGSGDDPGEGDSGFEDGENDGESGDEGPEEGEGDSDAEEDGDGQGDPEDDESEGDSEGGSDDESEGESEGESDDESDSACDNPPKDGKTDALARQLDLIEAMGAAEAKREADAQIARGATEGGENALDPGWTLPSAENRETKKGAERFLRGMINPTESAKVVLTETPCATVDGAALAAWKASGQVREPVFFKRTRREVQPAPPVKIAVLVDVSASMDVMQEPSALLSWAIAAAAQDLKNFAGRGQQIESALIHWGTKSRVVQHVGQSLPGLRSVPCREGTSALDWALAQVEDEMPGFFEQSDRPVNRLLVQFTDWQLEPTCAVRSAPLIRQGLNSGMNMLSVVPSTYGQGWRTSLEEIVRPCLFAPGKSTLLRYNPMFPEAVWEAAVEAMQ